MKKIEVFGTGCPKCKKTIKNIEQVINENGFDAEIKKVEDIKKITERGIFITPAVAVDGEIKIKGRIAREKDIIEWF